MARSESPHSISPAEGPDDAEGGDHPLCNLCKGGNGHPEPECPALNAYLTYQRISTKISKTNSGTNFTLGGRTSLKKANQKYLRAQDEVVDAQLAEKLAFKEEKKAWKDKEEARSRLYQAEDSRSAALNRLMKAILKSKAAHRELKKLSVSFREHGAQHLRPFMNKARDKKKKLMDPLSPRRKSRIKERARQILREERGGAASLHAELQLPEVQPEVLKPGTTYNGSLERGEEVKVQVLKKSVVRIQAPPESDELYSDTYHFVPEGSIITIESASKSSEPYSNGGNADQLLLSK